MIDGDEEDDGVTEVELSREKAYEMSLHRNKGRIPEARWDRIREEIPFYEVVTRLTDNYVPRQGSIRCPFHGRDSSPSFNIFPEGGSNDGWCYGCPEGDKYWDSVKFVSRIMEIPRPKALRWLEKEFELPHMPDEEWEPEEEEELETIELSFKDLASEYKKSLPTKLANLPEDQRVSEARRLLTIFFQAKDSEDPLPLAKVLGIDKIQGMLTKKGS